VVEDRVELLLVVALAERNSDGPWAHS